MTTAPIASVFPQRMTGCGEGIVATVRRLGATFEVRSVGLGRKTINMLCKSAMLAVQWKWVPDTTCKLTHGEGVLPGKHYADRGFCCSWACKVLYIHRPTMKQV